MSTATPQSDGDEDRVDPERVGGGVEEVMPGRIDGDVGEDLLDLALVVATVDVLAAVAVGDEALHGHHAWTNPVTLDGLQEVGDLAEQVAGQLADLGGAGLGQGLIPVQEGVAGRGDTRARQVL